MADKAIMKVRIFCIGTRVLVHVGGRIFSNLVFSALQQIAEQKLKAFSIGTMGKRPLSKKELEEQRKKEQEQAAAQVNIIAVYNCSLAFSIIL